MNLTIKFISIGHFDNIIENIKFNMFLNQSGKQFDFGSHNHTSLVGNFLSTLSILPSNGNKNSSSYLVILAQVWFWLVFVRHHKEKDKNIKTVGENCGDQLFLSSLIPRESLFPVRSVVLCPQHQQYRTPAFPQPRSTVPQCLPAKATLLCFIFICLSVTVLIDLRQLVLRMHLSYENSQRLTSRAT